MLNRMRSDEGGFTLIELLVVILIIGILAAIALPSFLGQQDKGKDASAKSDARNMVSQMESCYTDNDTYTNCPSTTTGLSLGTSPGQVNGVPTPDGKAYEVTGYSKSGNNFKITKATNGTISRSCTTTGQGGCPSTGSW